MNFQLREADTTLKVFLTTFILVLTLGYFVGLIFVEHTSSFSSTGVQEQFRGTSEISNTPEMKYEKSLNEMYVFLHNHILSLSLVFVILGGIFYFSSIVPEGLKRFLMIEPLIAIVTTFGGIALVRFVSPVLSWLVLISGASLFICYGAMVFLILKELWLTGENPTKT